MQIGDWGLLGDKSSNIINEINFQSSSNPTLDLKVKVISFFSRDLEDDDEEDFKLNLDADDEGDDKGDDKRDDKGDFILNLDHNTYIIIISIVAALIIISIIVSVIYLKKRKRKDKNIDDLNASLSLNE